MFVSSLELKSTTTMLIYLLIIYLNIFYNRMLVSLLYKQKKPRKRMLVYIHTKILYLLLYGNSNGLFPNLNKPAIELHHLYL